MRRFGALAKLSVRGVRGGAAESFASSVPDGRYADRTIAIPLHVGQTISRLVFKKLYVLEIHLETATAPPNKPNKPDKPDKPK